MLIEADRRTFEAEVLQAEGTVIVDYFSESCVPCMALKPHVEELAKQYGDKLKFVALDTAKARRVAIGQKILGIPVVAVYQNGEKVEELVQDDCTVEAVEALVKKYY
ncbi:MAG: thioredoxin TrxA [Saccharofermentanales bacterium]|jgi:thioredoxin 1